MNSADGIGNLIILSGPSGAGKSALAASVLGSIPGLGFSVSYTTRPPRGTEKDGVEYHFIGHPEFQELISSGDLLEWAEVYGNLYGSSRKRIYEILDRGADVLMDIDVQGARTVRSNCPGAVSIFVLPPSFGVLRERLERRKLDKDYVIEQRLRIASEEIRHYSDYDYLIINDEFGSSVESLGAIIVASRCRSAARKEAAKSILATFGGLDAEDS